MYGNNIRSNNNNDICDNNDIYDNNNELYSINTCEF